MRAPIGRRNEQKRTICFDGKNYEIGDAQIFALEVLDAEWKEEAEQLRSSADGAGKAAEELAQATAALDEKYLQRIRQLLEG